MNQASTKPARANFNKKGNEMKALNFITAAVAFVAIMGLVGCGNDGIVEFQPQDELDKAALAVAKEVS